MKIYYVGSFDPPHVGHLNTYKKACAKLDTQIGIAICANELKVAPLLELEERAYLCKLVFQTNNIIICKTSSEIKQFVEECDMFVRGYHDKSDEQYIQVLVDYYKLENVFEKVLFVPIENEYSKISSSKIKLLLNDGEDVKHYLPQTVYEYFDRS